MTPEEQIKHMYEVIQEKEELNNSKMKGTTSSS